MRRSHPRHLIGLHRSFFALTLLVSLAAGSLSLAQSLQFELKGLRNKTLSPGTQVRLVWQGTDSTVATLDLDSGKKARLNPLAPIVGIPGLPSKVSTVLGIESCNFTPTLSAADGRLVAAEFVMYNADGKPVALIEFRGNRGPSVDRSILVYADRDLRVEGQGICSHETFGQVELKLNLKKGFNWITYSTTITFDKNQKLSEVTTQVKMDSKPSGAMEMAPLRNP